MIEKSLLALGTPPKRAVLRLTGGTVQAFFEFGAEVYPLDSTRSGAPRTFLSLDSAVKTVRKLFPGLSEVNVVFLPLNDASLEAFTRHVDSSRQQTAPRLVHTSSRRMQ